MAKGSIKRELRSDYKYKKEQQVAIRKARKNASARRVRQLTEEKYGAH